MSIPGGDRGDPIRKNWPFSKNSGSNLVTFAVLEGLPLASMIVWPPEDPKNILLNIFVLLNLAVFEK